MNYKETTDIWRLYRREWIITHTITAQAEEGHPVFTAAMRWMEENLKDRVREKDLDIQLNTDGTGMYWAHVKVFRDNLKGEFKDFDNAQLFAQTQGYDEYTIVPRNSKADHDIRSYGVVKL